jgi:hypothetical protein
MTRPTELLGVRMPSAAEKIPTPYMQALALIQKIEACPDAETAAAPQARFNALFDSYPGNIANAALEVMTGAERHVAEKEYEKQRDAIRPWRREV